MSGAATSDHRSAAGLATLVAGGFLFAVGLGIAGMTDANKVLAFLDLSSGWDPSLGVVMAAALAVYGAANQLARRRAAPLFAPAFALPTRRDINLRLLGGAALFGAGWGLGGYCPGPALTSLPSLAPEALLFVVTLSVGWAGAAALEVAFDRRRVAQAIRPAAR